MHLQVFEDSYDILQISECSEGPIRTQKGYQNRFLLERFNWFLPSTKISSNCLPLLQVVVGYSVLPLMIAAQ